MEQVQVVVGANLVGQVTLLRAELDLIDIDRLNLMEVQYEISEAPLLHFKCL